MQSVGQNFEFFAWYNMDPVTEWGVISPWKAILRVREFGSRMGSHQPFILAPSFASSTHFVRRRAPINYPVPLLITQPSTFAVSFSVRHLSVWTEQQWVETEWNGRFHIMSERVSERTNERSGARERSDQFEASEWVNICLVFIVPNHIDSILYYA